MQIPGANQDEKSTSQFSASMCAADEFEQSYLRLMAEADANGALRLIDNEILRCVVMRAAIDEFHLMAALPPSLDVAQGGADSPDGT